MVIVWWLPPLGVDGSGVGSILMKLGGNYKWLFFTKTIFILFYFVISKCNSLK